MRIGSWQKFTWCAELPDWPGSEGVESDPDVITGVVMAVEERRSNETGFVVANLSLKIFNLR